jgi:hypothetical protein
VYHCTCWNLHINHLFFGSTSNTIMPTRFFTTFFGTMLFFVVGGIHSSVSFSVLQREPLKFMKSRCMKSNPGLLPPKVNLQSATALLVGGDDEDYRQVKKASSVEEQDNFDSQGFAGYLAPYALAVVASVAVTAGFVKFVLLDY